MFSYDDEEDKFYDANENIDTSSGDCSSPEDNFTANEEVEFSNYGTEFLARQLMSIEECRIKFFGKMGFHELMQFPTDCSIVSSISEKEMSRERIIHDVVSLSAIDVEDPGNLACHKRDLDGGRSFVRDIEQDGTSGTLNEIGSNKLMSSQELEISGGLDHCILKLSKRQDFCEVEKPSSCRKQKETKLSKLWRSFKKRKDGPTPFKHDSSVRKFQLPRLIKRKIKKQGKRCKEATALYAGQEIKAHKGLIRTMKFNPSGRYLASGGDDCSVLIWQIREVETCCSCFFEASNKLDCNVRDRKIWNYSCCHSSPILFPQRFFEIDETPAQALVGHTSGILDLSWSNSNMLLTASKDKTVRMWEVGHNGCLKVFLHCGYVTCVQFNPIDSRFFISGSIDGKVRIWSVTDSRVADWIDVQDIVTSICYHPDGEGFVVGLINGNSLYYDCSVGSLQRSIQLFVRGKGKSSAKSITGLQLFQKDSRRTIVTSSHSRIQILDGAEIVLKLKGHRRVKRQFSASLSSDGKHIISVGDDSHVYIWNYDESIKTSSKGAKSVCFCESFSSEGASIAVSWCGRNQEEAIGDSSNNNLVSSSPSRTFKPSSRPRDTNYCSHGGWLFYEFPSSVSATWPEENLPSTTEFPSDAETCHNLRRCCHHKYYPGVKSVPLTWSRIILTGGIDGTIRAFHYCGCPLGCK